MKVSVITATFNSARTVRDTLVSVRNQDYPIIEHIIIDGGSKDETMAIVSSFPHVAYSQSAPDKGIYDAMNRGLQVASGDVIGILNSDDMYSADDIISRVVSCFLNQETDAVYGDLQYVDSVFTEKVLRHWRSGSYRKGSFKLGWMPPHPTFFVRRDVYEQFGVFRLDMGTAADYELMLRFIHKHGIRLQYIPDVLVKMRAGGASNSKLCSRLKANSEDRKAWQVNGLKPLLVTSFLKPLRKVPQFLRF